MATPIAIHPVATSTPLRHISHSRHHSYHPSHPEEGHDDVTMSSSHNSHTIYSDHLHPVLSNRRSNHIQSHRQRIVKEIFDTEHTYLSQLDTIVTLFLKPIRVGGLLPSNAINDIFSNIEAILLVNTELFSSMRQRSLGEAFAYLGPFLKLYATYANNFELSGRVLQHWEVNSAEFSSFIRSQEMRPECCGLNLSALLITPVQRVPRYKLLLEDLLKHTKPLHIDYAKLKAASAEIAAVAVHINEHIRQNENFKKMLSIQNSLTGNCVPGILAPGRKFVKEGRLMKVCRKKAKERMVFLFSDILIYATPTLLEKKDQPRSYECRCVLPLLNSSVKVVHGDDRAPGVKKLFRVSNLDTTLMFTSLSEDTVLRWAKTTMKVVSELQAAYGSLMNSQKVVLHHLTNHGGLETCLEEEGENRLDLEEETKRRRSLLASTGDSLTPCTPYPLTSTLFTSSRTAQEPSSRQRKMSVFAFDQNYNSNRELELYDSDEAEETGSGHHHQEWNRRIGSTDGQNDERDELNKETAVEVNEAEDERTSLLPAHGAFQATSIGSSLSTINIPDSKYSRCCSIL